MEISETRAKQGGRGRRVLIILCASMMLIMGGYALIAISMPDTEADLIGETSIETNDS